MSAKLTHTLRLEGAGRVTISDNCVQVFDEEGESQFTVLSQKKLEIDIGGPFGGGGGWTRLDVSEARRLPAVMAYLRTGHGLPEP
jgi:hypothetical protein